MLSHPSRNYCLLSGPLDPLGEFPEGLDHWWPAEYAWCLSGDTAPTWAYLAGSEVCVDGVLDTPELTWSLLRQRTVALCCRAPVLDPSAQ